MSGCLMISAEKGVNVMASVRNVPINRCEVTHIFPILQAKGKPISGRYGGVCGLIVCIWLWGNALRNILPQTPGLFGGSADDPFITHWWLAISERAILRPPENRKSQPERLACCVDQTGKFSNLLEDLLKVEIFSQYIENQVNDNLTKTEVSQK